MIQISKATLILLIIFTQTSDITGQLSEADYADMIQRELGGKREVSVTSGWVDLVTETHAYEVEWADKWKHAIGQALWYGLQTNKTPGIILIMEDSGDFKYTIQLGSALDYAGLGEAIEVRVWYGDGWLEE